MKSRPLVICTGGYGFRKESKVRRSAGRLLWESEVTGDSRMDGQPEVSRNSGGKLVMLITR